MTWKADASESRRVWPHAVFDRIKMTVRAFARMDEEEVSHWQANNWESGTGVPVNANAHWDLFQSDAKWDNLKVSCDLSIDDVDEFSQLVFPADQHPDASIGVMLRCPRTRWRQIALDTLDMDQPLELTIPKDHLFGALEIQPVAVLGNNIELIDQFASTKAAIVGTGFPVDVNVDEPAEQPGRGLPRKWMEFPESLGNALWKLEFVEEQDAVVPTLYINSNHSAIKAIVDFAGRKQPTAQARDSLYSLMASEVWMELAAYAADALNDELESGDPRRKLAERIARTLKRHARLGKPELEGILENEDARSDACQRIQHWLGVAPKQSDLVLAFEDSADN